MTRTLLVDGVPTFGTAYYPDHWPEAAWERDLKSARDCGVRLVRFGEFSWSWFEPSEGAFDFAAYDRFVDLAAGLGLKLLLCTPTATPPPWLMHRHPDGYLQDAQGHSFKGARHFGCWHHPGMRAAAERTIRALAGHYAPHEAVVGWQIDNEPNYAENTTIHDYNPHALADWRRWLREKHGSLGSLNDAWYTNFWSQRYSDWEHLPHLDPIRSNPNAWLDFARHRENFLARFVRWQRDLLREVGDAAGGPAADWALGTNIPDPGLRLSAFIGQDYFDQAAGLDWVGTDLYMASGDRAADLREMRYRTDLMRSVAEAGGGEFSIMETQAGPHQRTWRNTFAGEAWGPDYLDAAARIYIEHGADLVAWFLLRPTPAGREIGMNGLLAADGGPSPRTEAAGQLHAEGDALLDPRKARAGRPLALMHYSRDSVRWATYWSGTLDDFEASYLGWHRLLDETGHRLRFVSDRELADGLPAAAEDAAVMVLPESHLLSDTQIDAALAWQAGGDGRRVICGPHTAMLDERGHLRQQQPGGRLAEAAGVTLGYWNDITETPLPTVLGGGVVRGCRTLEADGQTRMMKPGGVTWLAFDAGGAYEQAEHDTQRQPLRELVAPAP